MKKTLLVCFFAAVCGGCLLIPFKPEAKRTPELFLQAFLAANGPLTNIKLRKTIPPDRYYDFMPLARYDVSNAVVAVAENGRRHVLPETAPGTYGDASLIAVPGVTYDVEVTFPPGHEFAGRVLTGRTTVPHPPRTTVAISPYYVTRGAQYDGRRITGLEFPRELAYPDSFGVTREREPFEVSWTNTSVPAGYFLAAVANDTTGTGLLRERAYRDWQDGDLNDPVIRQGTRAGGYFVMPDSMRTSAFWLLFNYRGWHDVSIVACDSAYWDYMVTVFNDAGSGSDSDAGVVLNVRGGLGIFCSYAADTIRTFIKPEWLPSSR